jgi:nitrite reductase/ring-hydroxylating ferredoxin subunit
MECRYGRFRYDIQNRIIAGCTCRVSRPRRHRLPEPASRCISLGRPVQTGNRKNLQKVVAVRGPGEYVPNSGDYYTIDVLGDKLIVVRGEDGEIRALSSVCRHRFMTIVQEADNTQRFICPYHAWTYATDGRLVAAPYMEGSKRFVKENYSLPQYRLETWAGFLFINFDKNAPSLQSRMQTLDGWMATSLITGCQRKRRYSITSRYGKVTGNFQPKIG